MLLFTSSITILVSLLTIGTQVVSACVSNAECGKGNVCRQSTSSGLRTCYPASCPDEWILEDGMCFFFSKDETNWKGANAACANLGAALAEVYDKAKDSFILAQAEIRNDRYFWLGGSDIAEEGKFAWNSGAPWGYENWKDKNPDNSGGEDCLHTYWRSSGAGWNDWGCEHNGAYLCEKKPIVCCPEGWVVYNNDCLLFSQEKTNWKGANAACNDKGAALAEIYDKEMDSFVLAEAEQRSDRFFWLGGSDIAIEGKFEWNSGAPWGYENWKDNNPDNSGGEDCLHTYWRSSGAGWNDWGCEHNGEYLCQIKLGLN